ncbi:MAG: hypothetical protein JJE39_02030 [Vicinamibacteria bacterium]|nr:hypothetical protein [Vicinamibacteria bacterium]
MNIEALSAPTHAALRQLVDAYRARCLWSFRADFYPETVQDAEGVLDAVQRYGDREGFIRSAEIRTWLSQTSSAPSASS